METNMVTKTVKSNLKLFKILESMNKLLTTITLICFSVAVAAQNDDQNNSGPSIQDLTLPEAVIPDNASISEYERMERERMDVSGTLFGTVQNLSNEKFF